MSEPAKDEAELLDAMVDAIWEYLTPDTRWTSKPYVERDLAAAIRAAGWAVVPIEPVCVNAHDRCYGGAGGPCPLCEMPAAPGVKP